MNRLLSFYNQNRAIIWITVFCIVVVISIIQALNSYYKNRSNDESSSTNISTTTYNTNTYSIITEEEISESTAEESTNLIAEFFDYCNSGDIEEAYNLLSTDCKEELYPTVEEFQEKYYDQIFTEQKSYNSMLWITTTARNTYKIEIMNDLLATGEKEYMPIEEYYTISSEEGEYKLSINGYVGEEEINVSKTQDDITITVLCKKMYIEYETYEIEVQNNTGNKLIFNTKENTDSIYIEDENELQYVAFINELADNELQISNGVTKTLKIRFNRSYKPTIAIEKIVFGDISINDNEIEQIEIEL